MGEGCNDLRDLQDSLISWKRELRGARGVGAVLSSVEELMYFHWFQW